MKTFEVEIYFDSVLIKVKAKNKREAKKKAMARLKKKNPINFIYRRWPELKRDIYIEEL